MKDATREAAVNALEQFWGRSLGGNDDYAALQDSLSKLRLSKADLDELELNLPIPETQGTTAARIGRARQAIAQLRGRM